MYKAELISTILFLLAYSRKYSKIESVLGIHKSDQINTYHV